MKQTYFTVGPSQLYPTIAKHLQKAMKEDIGSISHRGKDFAKLFQETTTSLKKLLNISGDYFVFFLSSGNEAMERVLENCVEKKSFHIITGSFSERFFDFANELKKNPGKVLAPEGEGIAYEQIKIPKETELICFTQNETSTGVWIPEETIAKVKKQNPNILVAVDVVSSLPYVNLNFPLADCVFFSVQKLFGLPAGLGVIIVSPKAIEKAESLQKKNISIGTYHSFVDLRNSALKNQTPETPPVLHMYLLNAVLHDMLQIGLGKIREETEKKAKLLYNFFDKSNWNPFVAKPVFRSPTVIVIETGKDTEKVKTILKEKGLIVGSGYGKHKTDQIRIANFPAIYEKDIKRLIACLRKAS